MAVTARLDLLEMVLNVKVIFISATISNTLSPLHDRFCKKNITIVNLFQSDSDVDECKEKSACQCDGCSCKDTWGGYDCKCKGDLLYIKEQDICIGKKFKS